MTVTFHNVTIVVDANTPCDAYELLEDRMFPMFPYGVIAWSSDSYSIDDDEKHHDTADLFGKIER